MQVNYIVLKTSSDSTFLFPGGAKFQLLAVKVDDYYVVITQDFGSRTKVIIDDMLFIRTEHTIEEAIQGTLDAIEVLIKMINNTIANPKLLESPVFILDDECYARRCAVVLKLHTSDPKLIKNKTFTAYPILHRNSLTTDDLETIERAITTNNASYLNYVAGFQAGFNIISIVLPKIDPYDCEMLLNYRPGVKSDVYIEGSDE